MSVILSISVNCTFLLIGYNNEWLKRQQHAKGGIRERRHLFFLYLGAFAAPWISIAFSKSDTTSLDLNQNDILTAYSNTQKLNSSSIATTQEQYMFYITGSYQLLPAIIFIVPYFTRKYIPPPRMFVDNSGYTGNYGKSDCTHWSIRLTLFFSGYFYVGLEVTSVILLTVYVLRGLSWAVIDALVITGAFRGFYLIGWSISSFLSSRISCAKMIIVDLLFIFGGYTIMLCTGTTATILWVYISLVGTGLGGIIRSIMEWISNHIDMKQALLHKTGICSGIMTLPTLTAFLMHHFTADFYIYCSFLLAVCVLLATVFLFVAVVCQRKRNNDNVVAENESNAAEVQVPGDFQDHCSFIQLPPADERASLKSFKIL